MLVACVREAVAAAGAEVDRLDRPRHCSALETAGHEGLLAGLESVGQAGGLLDLKWRVLAMNAAGDAMLGGIVEARNGRLAGRTHTIDLRLRRLMASLDIACSGCAIISDFAGATLVVRAARLAAPVGRAATILTFARPGETRLPDEAVLREGFGLTATEASIALAIAGGHELRRIANNRGSTLATVRSHLRAIFAKTGTRRQAALVILLAGIVSRA